MATSFTSFLVSVALHWFTAIHAEDYNIKTCFKEVTSANDSQGNVTLNCSPGYMISVKDALFGRNQWGLCDLTKEDCVEKTNLFKSCDGLNNCTKIFKTYSNTCGDSTTLLLIYSCIRSFANLIQTTSQPPRNSPDYVETTVTSPVKIQGQTENKGGGTVSKGDRTVSKGDRTVSKDPYQQDGGGEENEDLGVIIGCAVAAILTIIMLLFAITMVLRALLQFYKREKTNGSSTTPKVVNCLDSICLKVDRLPCFSSSTDENQGLRGRKRSTSETDRDMECKKLSTSGSRIAPVGQECSSASEVSADYDMQNNQAGPLSTSLSSPDEHQNDSADSQMRTNQIGSQDASLLETGRNDTNGLRSSKNSSHQTKNCPDKVSTWREKEMSHGILAEYKNNNQRLPEKIVDINEEDVPKFRPKFDAVAIPNTESGTLC